jgi:hypothetical protein
MKDTKGETQWIWVGIHENPGSLTRHFRAGKFSHREEEEMKVRGDGDGTSRPATSNMRMSGPDFLSAAVRLVMIPFPLSAYVRIMYGYTRNTLCYHLPPNVKITAVRQIREGSSSSG